MNKTHIAHAITKIITYFSRPSGGYCKMVVRIMMRKVITVKTNNNLMTMILLLKLTEKKGDFTCTKKGVCYYPHVDASHSGAYLLLPWITL